MKFSREALRPVTILEGLSDAELDWFAAHGDRLRLSRGDHMFKCGEPADFMWIVVRGTIDGYEEVGGQLLRVATTQAGQVTGMLPYSRMTHYPRFTVAVEDTEVLRVRKSDFPGMLAASHEIGQRLVAIMSDRVRGDVRLEQQQERMAALGRLSAGLAHELNNPAAAVQRAAAGLAEELTDLTAVVSALAVHQVTEADMRAIRDLQQQAGRIDAGSLSALERSEREDDLATWLEERGIPKPWNVAASFTDAGLGVEDLERLAGAIPAPLVADALAWVACGLGVRRSADVITSSAGRISDLIGSVKTYSHMDRSPEHRPTDIREGIDSTLTLLSHKIRKKSIRLVHEAPRDLPRVSGNAGELSQVWTNLIDNAIDAVDEGGEIRIALRRSDGHVEVDFVDDGHGIPADVLPRIFEPFFTTKTVGEGTGMGLDIAMRIVRTHGGGITVESRPRHTVMRVRLPVTASAA